MTNDLEKQFFDTFGIEPNNICKYAKYGYDGTEGTWYFCSKNQKECWTYPADTTCKDKRVSYPQIIDRIYLNLILIMNPYAPPVGDTMEEMKSQILYWCIKCGPRIKNQVQALFEEG